MIPYVELLDKYSLKAFAMVEPKELWFELSYFEVGECEIYCSATPNNVNNIKIGHYLKLPNKNYLWVITALRYEYNAEGSKMIIATGKEAKHIIGYRAILNPKQLPNTLGGAIGDLIRENITESGARRIINFGYGILDTTPIEPMQATRGNLLEFMLALTKTYDKGFQVNYSIYSPLYFSLIEGQDRSGYILFSQSMDNLLSSSYYKTDEEQRTFAQVVSKVEEVDYVETFDKTEDLFIDRKEIVVESNVSTKYTPEGKTEEVEIAPSDPLYKSWLRTEGKNKLAEHNILEEVEGEIDMMNSNYEFDRDYNLGDIVKIKDEDFNYEFKVRILKFTFKQDAKGYGEEVAYGNI